MKSSTWPPCHVQGPLEYVSPNALGLGLPGTPLSPEGEYSEWRGNLSGFSKPLKPKSNRRGKRCPTGKHQRKYQKDEYQKECLIGKQKKECRIGKQKKKSPPKTHATCDVEIAKCFICDWAESTEHISDKGTLPKYVQDHIDSEQHINSQHHNELKHESPKTTLTSRKHSALRSVEKAAREKFNLKGEQRKIKIKWLGFCPVPECKQPFEARTEDSTFKDVGDRFHRHEKFTKGCTGSSPKEPQFECGYCGAMLTRIDSRAKHEASCNGNREMGQKGLKIEPLG